MTPATALHRPATYMSAVERDEYEAAAHPSPEDIAVVIRVAVADCYDDSTVTADDRLHLLTLFPQPDRYAAMGANGIGWWMDQHIGPRLQAVADKLRDWHNFYAGIEDFDGRLPTEPQAHQSLGMGEALASVLIRDAARALLGGCSAAVSGS